MGSFSVNNGAWTDVRNLHVNTGSWNQAKKLWVHNGSGWVLAWQNEVTEYFPFSAGQTYYGTVLDSNGYYGRTKLTTTRGTKALIQGEYGTSPANQRGLWIPGNGTVSGQTIANTLNGRTVASLKISLGLAWTWKGRFHSDGSPARMAIYGTSFSSIPTDFNPSTMTYLGVVSWYPEAIDYTLGFATITAGQLGVNPNYDGDRYPVFYNDIDITSQLSSTAHTKLTDGSIKSFAMQAYNKAGNNLTGNQIYYLHSMEPGETYTTSGIPATGPSTSFRVKITHTG